MFLTPQDRLRREQRENDRLRSELDQTKADLDYVTMMAGVDIPLPMNENEQEVPNHEPQI